MMLWTVGHSTQILPKLTDLLKEHWVDVLVDIRSFPTSAPYPHFRKEHLEQCLPEVGIEYLWLGKQLGGHRKKSDPNSPHSSLASPSFRDYADHTASKEFRQAAAELQTLAAKEASRNDVRGEIVVAMSSVSSF